jgi:hypothetical protein
MGFIVPKLKRVRKHSRLSRRRKKLVYSWDHGDFKVRSYDVGGGKRLVKWWSASSYGQYYLKMG